MPSQVNHATCVYDLCGCVLQSLQKAQEQGDLPAEVVRVLQTLIKNKQAHVVAQAALAGLVLVVAAAWLGALLLLPVCWTGLGGTSGCSVSGWLAGWLGSGLWCRFDHACQVGPVWLQLVNQRPPLQCV